MVKKFVLGVVLLITTFSAVTLGAPAAHAMQDEGGGGSAEGGGWGIDCHFPCA